MRIKLSFPRMQRLSQQPEKMEQLQLPEEIPVDEGYARLAGAEDEEEEKGEDCVVEREDDSYFTETLAKIYIKQHRYEKALEIIKKLSLNYPKKNAYFADQIRFLEKLIINAKSK